MLNKLFFKTNIIPVILIIFLNVTTVVFSEPLTSISLDEGKPGKNIQTLSDLIYSTYLGGSNLDIPNALIVDSYGNIYITGRSSSNDFPFTAGAIDTVLLLNEDVFVTKIESSGKNLYYSTFLGGAGNDSGNGITVNPSGQVFVVGQTLSTDFPVTSNSFQTSKMNGTDVFVSKLNNHGTGLEYSTYLGGNEGDVGRAITIDSAGNVFITGVTSGQEFPITPGAYDTSNNSNANAFVTKLNNTGTSLVYSTFLGGSNQEEGLAIAIDSIGQAYVTGYTQTPEFFSDRFPTTPSAFDTSYNGIPGEAENGRDIFITKFNSSGSGLIYSTYLGGGYKEYGQGIYLDREGYIYITGFTTSTTDFPVTSTSIQTSQNGNSDAFLTKLNPSGNNIIYSTFLGGTGEDNAFGILADYAGNIYIIGYTSSSIDFPITSNAFDTSYNGGTKDVFLSRLNSEASTLIYSSFLGGNSDDQGYGIQMNHSGEIFGIGLTQSNDFPLTSITFDSSYNGNEDTFIAKMRLSSQSPQMEFIPSLKLFINEDFNPAFDFSDFNQGGQDVNYSVLSSFQNLASITGTEMNQQAYNQATTVTNLFKIENSYASISISHKVKYSNYKIARIPQIGLNIGSSFDLNMADYTFDSTGIITSSVPSFGSDNSLIISDTSKISAFWINDSILQITLLSNAPDGVYLDVIASPNAIPPFEPDMDKQRVWVFSNLLSNSTFSSNNDILNYGYELAPGRSTQASISFSSTITDTNGMEVSGIATITFNSNQSGLKATPLFNNHINYQSGNWYTARMRILSNLGNTHQAQLFNYSNSVPGASHISVSGYVLFGIPSTWTWMESPLYSFETGMGYPQFILKAGAAGLVHIDEIQIIKSTPSLISLNRGMTHLDYPGGDFNLSSDMNYWGKEGYPIATGQTTIPLISVNMNSSLNFDFTGAGSGSLQKGLKWTASSTASVVGLITPFTPIGTQLGVKATVSKGSNNFKSLSSLILLAAYGVSSSGQSQIGTIPSDLIASAEFGRITDGIHYAIGKSMNPYHQFQFGVKNNESGILSLDDIDLMVDHNEIFFGEFALFP